MEGDNIMEGRNEWANHVGVARDSEDSVVMSIQFIGLTAKLAVSRNYSDTDILLDKGSTVSVFNNKKMLLNLRRSKKTLRAFSNWGF